MEENKAITSNVGEVYLLKSGEMKNPLNLNDYHPLSTTNGLLVHIEDGMPTNIVTVNYKPQNMSGFVSHEFPLFYRGMVDKKVYGATRTFAQYFTWVPTILLAMNKNKNTTMSVELTVTQSTGQNLLGGFGELVDLINEHPPTVELQDDRAIAYVIEPSINGFYNVIWTGEMFVWEKIIMPLTYYDIDVKQYNPFEIIVQKGNAPSSAAPIKISDEIVRLLYQEIAHINYSITELNSDISGKVDKINNLGTHYTIDDVDLYAVDYQNVGKLIRATVEQGSQDTIVKRNFYGEIEDLKYHNIDDDNAHKRLFDEKLDIEKSQSQEGEVVDVYSVDNSDNQVLVKATPFKEGNTIIKRDRFGSFQGMVEHNTSPTAHNAEFAEKLDKVETTTVENFNRVYAVNKNGNQIMIGASVQALDGMIVMRDSSGHIPALTVHNTSPTAHSDRFNEKLDKIWTNIARESTTYLTDDLIINRNGEAYKTTLANLLMHSDVGDIFIVVAELPTEDIIPNKIYLLPKDESETGNLWDEYIYLNGQWELIGSVTVDLTNYYDKNEINNLLSGKVDKANGYGLIADDDYGKFINAEKVVSDNYFVVELQESSEVSVPFDFTLGKLYDMTLYIDNDLILDDGVPQSNYDWYNSEQGYFVLKNQPLGFEWRFSYVDNKVVDMGDTGGELKFLVNIRDYVDSQIGDLADILASI